MMKFSVRYESHQDLSDYLTCLGRGRGKDGVGAGDRDTVL